jgi:hypothetical protein
MRSQPLVLDHQHPHTAIADAPPAGTALRRRLPADNLLGNPPDDTLLLFDPVDNRNQSPRSGERNNMGLNMKPLAHNTVGVAPPRPIRPRRFI